MNSPDWIKREDYSKKILITDGRTRIQVVGSDPGERVREHHHKKQTEFSTC